MNHIELMNYIIFSHSVGIFTDGVTPLGFVLQASGCFQFVDWKYTDGLVIYSHADLQTVIQYAIEYLS